MKMHVIGIAALSTILAVMLPTHAHAALLLAIDVNGVQACASDNNIGCSFGATILDTDPTLGRLAFGNTPVIVGQLEVSGSVQEAQIINGQNILNTSSTQIRNLGGTTATGFFAVSSTNFVPVVTQAFASGSATWQNAAGSSINMGWYNDAANQQGAETATDTPGLQIFACADAITEIADSTSCSSGAVPVFDPALFSMTLSTQFALVAGGVVVNRGQTEIKPFAAVPEPASMVLLGLGLLGAGIARRRR